MGAIEAIDADRHRQALADALEQQAATAEILRIISRSPADAQPVFDTIAAAALKLCGARSVNVFTYDGELLHIAALAIVDPQGIDAIRSIFPRPASRDSAACRAVLTRSLVAIPDVLADPDFATRLPAVTAGFRSVLGVPLLRDGQPIGAIAVGRAEPGPFPASQIALLQTFAEQAVIAIQNVRLFNETKVALEHQTATSDVLQVISGSMADANPVFEKILDSCQRLFCATDLGIFLVDAQERLNVGAYRGGFADWAPGAYPRPLAGTMSEMVIRHGALMHWGDMAQARDVPGYIRDAVRRSGNFAVASAPLVWEGQGIGTIDVMRKPPRAYSESELALLTTFADQAVIAIQNARLFNETKESLARQTATSDVLRVISRSVTDTQPVFDVIAERAARLTGAQSGWVFRFDGEWIHGASAFGPSPQARALALSCFPMRPSGACYTSRAIRDGSVVNVADALAETDPEYATKAVAAAVGYRSVLSVPMFRGRQVVGAISVNRTDVGRFADKEVELLQTFAEQAVIAIENVRLFTELQARTTELTRSVEQLRALSEVGQAVSSTLDLETVLSTIVSRATALAGMDGGAIYEYDEAREEFRLRAADRLPDELVEALKSSPPPKGEGAIGRLATRREPVAIGDIADPGSYQSRVREIVLRLGYRSLLAVPLLREEHLLGGLVVNRKRAGEFEPQVIELLKTFATQSALAIQNARLFREIEDKGRQLEIASRHKSAFLANMSHELRTPLNAIIGFTRIVMRRAQDQLEPKQYDNLGKILSSAQHLLSLINSVLDLAKVEAGRIEVNAGELHLAPLLEQCLRSIEPLLDGGVTLSADIDAGLPPMLADAEKLRQILINLLSNAAKFTARGSIRVRARHAGGVVSIEVADTGIGIPADKLESIFEEFEQVDASSTRAHGGSGLGLAIARRLARLMGGELQAQSTLGAGSTFTLTLPVRYRQPTS